MMPMKESTKKRAPRIVAPEKLRAKPRNFLDFNDILKQFEIIAKESDQITKKEKASLLQGISLVRDTLAEIKSRRANLK